MNKYRHPNATCLITAAEYEAYLSGELALPSHLHEEFEKLKEHAARSTAARVAVATKRAKYPVWPARKRGLIVEWEEDKYYDDQSPPRPQR